MPTPQPPRETFAAEGAECHRSGRLIWVPLRSKWVDAAHAPEEVVRQEWVRKLVIDGGFDLAQMDQEKRTQHGHGSPRADIVVWKDADAKSQGAAAILVVETKAVEGPVIESDFRQGASYATAGGAGFLIAATASSHSVYEMTPGFPGQARQINEWPTRDDFADTDRLEQLRRSLRVFDREEFQKLLSDCHNLLRDHHAMTPDKAFDTISKILFIKLGVERQGRGDTFTTSFLDDFDRTRIDRKRTLHDDLFEQTKQAFRADDLFSESERLDIADATFKAIVGKLERFNLSQTSEDIKGIAFEQFLGRTFRGELGQFFTPRPVVDFMVAALNPQEGELLCDPAAGSGGFLIKAFDHIRAAISSDIEQQKTAIFDQIQADYPADAAESALLERDHRIDAAFNDLNAQLQPTGSDGEPADTRVGRLAWRCIYGTDKEPRAARTAKMNMIMHGDGHGGIHVHDGLVNIDGIWDGRFDIVVTNPPFGATVTKAQLIGATRESNVPDDRTYERAQTHHYGETWRPGHQAVVNARRAPILDMFEIGKGKSSRQTEALFLERALRLLKPGGRLAIVLPNGILNAASLGWLRRWVEGKAYLRGVVALPVETFKFSKASVSASVVFLDKFNEEDAAEWARIWVEADTVTAEEFEGRRQALIDAATDTICTGNGDPTVAGLLRQLSEAGVHRVLPCEREFASSLVRDAGSTKVGKLKWEGRGGRGVSALKRDYLTAARAHDSVTKAALKSLRADLKAVDEAHSEAMWRHVRERFDYPVFMAAPHGVGITATGDTGPHVRNDLPGVLHQYREFRDSLAPGRSPDGVA